MNLEDIQKCLKDQKVEKRTLNEPITINGGKQGGENCSEKQTICVLSVRNARKYGEGGRNIQVNKAVRHYSFGTSSQDHIS